MSENELESQGLARAREAFAAVPYAKFLGLELCEIKSGEVSVCLDVRDELKQNQGVVHGGAVASLIDTASAFAILTKLQAEERVTTTDLTIHYLRPITGGVCWRPRGLSAPAAECLWSTSMWTITGN